MEWAALIPTASHGWTRVISNSRLIRVRISSKCSSETGFPASYLEIRIFTRSVVVETGIFSSIKRWILLWKCSKSSSASSSSFFASAHFLTSSKRVFGMFQETSSFATGESSTSSSFFAFLERVFFSGASTASAVSSRTGSSTTGASSSVALTISSKDFFAILDLLL